MGRPAVDPEIRFWKFVRKTRGCWHWTGATDSHGYGVFSLNYRSVGAHRFSYELAFGTIAVGNEVDHLCRNRACVKPAHMELVTPRENTLRGEGITARNARKTHCKWGHEYTPENTYVTPARPNARFCRTCKRERGHE